MTKAQDLRDQSNEELESSVDDARKALFELRGEVIQGGKIEKPHRIALQRKEIARILTILHEKQSVNRNLRKKHGSRKSRKSQNKKRNSLV